MNLTKCILFSPLFLSFSIIVVSAQEGYNPGLRLLEGYKLDAKNGLVYAANGLRIGFYGGVSAGYAADPKNGKDYSLFREQELKGHKVYIAITDIGVGTKWKPDVQRGNPKAGRILLVTFPLWFSADHAVNFHAEVLDDKELADALLMILSFDPSKQ